eukprot:tig00000944_g5927.t1
MVVKLTYFDAKGRAETCRLALHAAGVQFEDVRMDFFKGDLKQLQASGILTFNQVPFLEHDGFRLGQSMAILRYVGRKYNMYGSGSAEDEARINEVIDGTTDVFAMLYTGGKLLQRCLFISYSPTLKRWLGFFERILARNPSSSGYVVGDKLSIGDVALFDLLDRHANFWFDDLSEFPKLAALKAKVAANPGIAAWLSKRPDTLF